MGMRPRDAQILVQRAAEVLVAALMLSVISSAQGAQVTNASSHRRLVVCLDGTWNSPYDESRRDDGTKVLKPTNTLKMCRAVLPRDDAGVNQIAYYDIGVGSLGEYPGITNRLLHSVDRKLGGAWGAGFEGNVEDALHFLTLNYEEGDQVFIFGFSRGAATARAVTRFIDWAGGLPQKRDAYFLPVLFREYVLARGNEAARDLAVTQINASLARDERPPMLPLNRVTVRYLGVWDTVMALGARFKAKDASTSVAARSFHAGTSPAACVAHARQALAIDEQRFDFRPEIWQDSKPGQVMEQRWFAGVHSNVGGGYTDDGLANVAFRWILAGANAEGLATDREFTNHYRSFPLDRLYSSSSFFYRLLDALRFRSGHGKRSLLNVPASARSVLDASVVKRIRAPLADLRRANPKARPYRPDNVLAFLACQPNLPAYLASIGIDDLATKPLPPDVMERIAVLKADCPSPRP